MALCYEFSLGSVRAKEGKLFKRQDIDILLACESVQEFYSTLADKGFEGENIDVMLDNRTNELWRYVESVAPDFAQFDLLKYRNDLHNVKAAIKGVISGRQFEHLFQTPLTVDTDLIIKAVKDKRFNLLPEFMSEAAEQCYKLTAQEFNARLGDGVLDRAVSLYMLSCAKEKGDTVFNYFSAYCFYANVKIALRSAKTGADMNYLNRVLIPTENADIKALATSAVAGEEALLEYLKKQDLFGCATAAEEYEQSPALFEKYVDDRLMSIAIGCKLSTEGMDALFGYIIAVEAENKIIHMIKTGIATGASREAMAERLRRIYE
mgnify:CR=1 FL=1